MEAGTAFVRIGLLVTGEVAVRSAHSIQAHPGVDEVVVLGPARSKSFEVVGSARGCDLLVGTGPEAPGRAREHGVSLVWDGEDPADGVIVWGAAPAGLAIAMASRETDPRLVAVAHPDSPSASNEGSTRFPDPIGRVRVADDSFGGRPVASGRSPNEFAACLAVGAHRRVAVVDHGAFLSGVALAGGIAAMANGGPVWDNALPYLEAVTEMGLVMAENS